jgi:hypothetical protein
VTAATYHEAVRDFDHASLAALPAYAALRQALSDLASQGEPVGLGTWLAAIQDAATTTPYGDTCERCDMQCRCPAAAPFPHPCGAFRTWWPHKLERDGGWITGTYRCGRGHTSTCGYAIDVVNDL